MKKNFRMLRLRDQIARRASTMKGDPRSMFYGDPVDIDPEDAQDAIGHEDSMSSVAENAIADSEANDAVAAEKVATYQGMSVNERNHCTILPPLACWNALTIVNPMLGKVSAQGLNYMLLKSLNDYPFRGATIQGEYSSEIGGHVVTIDYSALWLGGSQFEPLSDWKSHMAALPFFRFAISASTLNARPGSQITIDMSGEDAQGTEFDTQAEPAYTFTIQRIRATEAIIGVYIPTLVVATRTLPILPIAGNKRTAPYSPGSSDLGSPKVITVYFKGTSPDEQVTITFPGYATKELAEVSEMYSLPAGLLQ